MQINKITRDMLVGGEVPIAYRFAEVDKESIDVDNRTVTISFSSEYEVERWGWFETLGHEPEEVDLSRLEANGPFLCDHNWHDQRGVVLRAWVKDKRGYAEIKISRNPLGEQLLIDIQDSIRTNISVGYRILEATLQKRSGDDEHYRITKWQPIEISSVSVPADPTVGVGRSEETTNSVNIKEERQMADENQQTETPAGNETRTPDSTITIETRGSANAAPMTPTVDTVASVSDAQRIAETGKQYGAENLANEFIRTGQSFEAFNIALVKELHGKRTDPDAESTMMDLDLPARDLQRYSILNLCRAVVTGNWKHAGLEREMSDAIAQRSGKEATGCYISTEALGFGLRQQLERQMLLRQQAAGTSGKGAELVATELHSELFIEALRAQTMLGSLGVRFLSGLVGNLDIPKQIGTATFYWLGEDEDQTDSDLTFSTVQMTPNTLGAAVPFTRRMMEQSSPDIEMLIRIDMMRELALAMDSAGLVGTGVANQPLGIINTPGIGAVDLSDGVNWAKIVEFETDVLEANANANNAAYLMRPSMKGVLKTTEKATGTAKYLCNDETNLTNGYNTVSGTQMPAGGILFGDYSQLMFGMWGALDVSLDTSTKAKSGGKVLRMFQDLDTALRHPQAFSYGQ